MTKVAYTSKQLGDQYLGKKPQGQFVLITMKIKNIGDKPQTLFDGNQKLFIGDTEYAADSEAAIYANPADQQVFITEINPGNAVTGTLVFDIPKGAKADRLDVHDSAFSGGAKIALR